MSHAWKCAGCGIETPLKVRRCRCPTGVVTKRGERSAWKIAPPLGLMSIAYVAVVAKETRLMTHVSDAPKASPLAPAELGPGTNKNPPNPWGS